MESDKSYLEQVISEFKSHIKTKFSNVNSCVKIIENNGENSYTIKFLQLAEYDLNVTLQIPADYKLINSIIIVNGSKNNHDIDRLLDANETFNKYMQEIFNKTTNDVLIQFYAKIHQFVDENFFKSFSEAKSSNKKSKEKKSSSKAKSEPSELGEEDESSKKVSMKTAGDVVKRIMWDEEINKEFVTVGYMDRFVGLKECTFNTFDWGDIVLADLGALAIPEHRITYFKYKNEIIWDKNNRLDNVYGSTGSNVTIYDVIKRLENLNHEAFVSSIQNEDLEDSTPNKVGRVRPIEKEKESSQPNYFISIPVTDGEIRYNIAKLTNDLIEENNAVENFLVPDTSFHLTICTLRIPSPQELKIVRNLMEEMQSDENFISEYKSISFRFEGIGEFHSKVFFVKCICEQMEKLEKLKKFILDKFKSSGVNTAGNYYEFVPHLTIFKISSNREKEAKKNSKTIGKNFTVDKFLNKELKNKYENWSFGAQDLKEIELCKMVNIVELKTYPVEHTINLNK